MVKLAWNDGKAANQLIQPGANSSANFVLVFLASLLTLNIFCIYFPYDFFLDNELLSHFSRDEFISRFLKITS